jgi:hypothetical protein
MLKVKDKGQLIQFVNEYGFAKVLETLADLANSKSDEFFDRDTAKQRNYSNLAVALEPAIKSAIEKDL